MTKRILEDVKVNVKWKISALWVAMMFLYVYADIYGFSQPGAIELMIAGEFEDGIKITQELLFGTAILMTIPIVMVFLSLALKAKVNRWVNIILGIVYTGVNIWFPLSVEGPWAYTIFYSIVEIVLTLLIIWYAWTWPKQEA